MKKLLIALALLLTTLTQAQNYGTKWSEPDPDFYYYLNLSFDANNAFNIKDNPRMKTQINGFDYNVEAGIKRGAFAPYVFYGQFAAANINNWGVGLDVYPKLFGFMDTAIGGGWGRVEQNQAGVGGFHARALSSVKITKNIALTARLQAQQRTDVCKGYIVEAALGLTFKLHAKD